MTRAISRYFNGFVLYMKWMNQYTPNHTVTIKYVQFYKNDTFKKEKIMTINVWKKIFEGDNIYRWKKRRIILTAVESV